MPRHLTSAIYIKDLTGAAKYEVSGESDSIGPAGGYNLVYDGSSHPSSVTHGSDQVAFTQPAQTSVTSEVVDDNGVLTSELLVVRVGVVHRVAAGQAIRQQLRGSGADHAQRLTGSAPRIEARLRLTCSREYR